VTFLAASVAAGTSEKNIGPMAKMDDISVERVMIGNSLAPDDARTSPLSIRNAAEFKAALIAKVTDRLVSGGVRVSPKSRNEIWFDIFGGKFESSECSSSNFVMLEVYVAGPKDVRVSAARTFLAVVDDERLASALIDAAVAAVDEFLADRKAYRE